MQPCGLRDLTRPWGATVVLASKPSDLRAAPAAPWPKGIQKQSCNLSSCGIWRTLGGDSRLALKPGGLRAAPAAPWPKGSKKTFMQPCGLRDLARPRGRQSFGLKAGRVAGYARGTLAQRGLKNIHATLWAAGFGTPLGATFVWPQDQASCGMCPQNLSQKSAKKHSCSPTGCGI